MEVVRKSSPEGMQSSKTRLVSFNDWRESQECVFAPSEAMVGRQEDLRLVPRCSVHLDGIRIAAAALMPPVQALHCQSRMVLGLLRALAKDGITVYLSICIYIYIYGPVFRVATPPPPPHMVWVPQEPPPPPRPPGSCHLRSHPHPDPLNSHPDIPVPPPPGQANPQPTINQP